MRDFIRSQAQSRNQRSRLHEAHVSIAERREAGCRIKIAPRNHFPRAFRSLPVDAENVGHFCDGDTDCIEPARFERERVGIAPDRPVLDERLSLCVKVQSDGGTRVRFNDDVVEARVGSFGKSLPDSGNRCAGHGVWWQGIAIRGRITEIASLDREVDGVCGRIAVIDLSGEPECANRYDVI